LFKVECPEALVADCDDEMIRDVLQRLLSNSLKFTDNGEIRLAVSESNGVVQYSVTDTGRGLDPTSVTQLLEPFVMATDVKNHTEGRGIGLFIARRQVEVLPGQLEISSDGLGHGAKTTVTLPSVAAPNKNH